MSLILPPEPTNTYLRYLFWGNTFPGNDAEREEIFIQLLENGLDPNQTGKVVNPLFLSISDKMSFKMLQAMLKHGLDVNHKNSLGKSILHEIAGSVGFNFCSLEKAELLFEQGLDINAQDLEGDTPLHKAAENGDKKWIDWLVCRGADSTLTNHRNKTPAEVACTGWVPNPWKVTATKEQVGEWIDLAVRDYLNQNIPQTSSQKNTPRI